MISHEFEKVLAGKMSLAKRALVCGVGTNDAEFVTTKEINGKYQMHLGYSAWLNMLKRCYSNEFKKRRPTYEGAEVCDEWKLFSLFLLWWKENYTEGWSLDKDIMGTGKIYSPETCVYVPVWINNFIEDSKASRGNTPIGVERTKSGRFAAYCRDRKLGGKVSIGTFRDIDSASKARTSFKLNILKRDEAIIRSIKDGLYECLVEKIMKQYVEIVNE